MFPHKRLHGVPILKTALAIAVLANRGSEFTAYFAKIDFSSSADLALDCEDWETWRAAYPEVLSYADYRFTQRFAPIAARPAKIRYERKLSFGGVGYEPSKSTKCKSISIAQGLKIAARYGLADKYRARNGFPSENFDALDPGFWQWIKHFPQIAIGDFGDILYEPDFRAFERECIVKSDIRQAIFDLNVERIINRSGDRSAVLKALNIPVSRSFEGEENGAEWNRPEKRFGGEIWAFQSSKSGFFNGKPRIAQLDRQKGKPRKYETPRKLDGEEGNKVFYPDVDRIACDLMSERFGIDIPVTPDNFWDVVLTFPLLIPVGITEGAKKALSLVSDGFPCVAVYGIGNWSVSGSSSPRILLPELAELAAGGRQIDIWYDNEDESEKVLAFISVRTQAARLRSAAIAAGSNKKTYPVAWDSALGKGIDDAKAAIRSLGQEDVGDWVEARRVCARAAYIQQSIAKLYTLDESRNVIDTVGDRFPDRDYYCEGQNAVLIGDTGAGKTHQICQLVKQQQELGVFIVIFTPTNNLGRQLAETLGLAHRSTSDSDTGARMDIGDVRKLAREVGGLVMCPDSLPVFGDLVKDRDYIVVCDEAAKILEHVAKGDTLASRYSQINGQFTGILAGSKFNILAEAKICERDLITYEGFSAKSSVIYRHRRETAKREVTVLVGNNISIETAFFDWIVQCLAAGEKLVIPCDSQRKCETIERLLRDEFPAKKGARNDALTSYLSDVDLLTKTPNQFLAAAQLDYLIFSPACKAGWDLTSEGYSFDRVCCLFSVLPTSDHIQMLARYRPHVPIYIACREMIPQYKDEVNYSQKELAAWHDELMEYHNFACGSPRNLKELSPLQEILMSQYRFNTIRNGLEKSIARYSLIDRLVADGHSVTEVPVSFSDAKELDPALYARLIRYRDYVKLASKTIEWEWAGLIANTPLRLEDDYRVADALDRLDAPTPDQRAKAFKIRLRDRFPGLDLDNQETIYYGTYKRGRVSRGADRYAQLSHRELMLVQQRERNLSMFGETLIPTHRLRNDGAIVALLLNSGILNLIGGEYSQDSPEMLSLSAYCLKNAKLFRNLLNLSFVEGSSPMKVYQRLLRTIGLSANETRRSGSDGSRVRWYRVFTCAELLLEVDALSESIEAAREQLRISQADSEVKLTTHEHGRDALDTAANYLESLKNPLPGPGAVGATADRLLRREIKAADRAFKQLRGRGVLSTVEKSQAKIDRQRLSLIRDRAMLDRLENRLERFTKLYQERGAWQIYAEAAGRKYAQLEADGATSRSTINGGVLDVDAKPTLPIEQGSKNQLELDLWLKTG